MRNLEDICTSLETSIKLSEASIKIDTLCYWVASVFDNEGDFELVSSDINGRFKSMYKDKSVVEVIELNTSDGVSWMYEPMRLCYPAPTAVELWTILPNIYLGHNLVLCQSTVKLANIICGYGLKARGEGITLQESLADLCLNFPKKEMFNEPTTSS